MLLYFVFFKQKTAYEMRISDWSSDVCSSDLEGESRGIFFVDAPVSGGQAGAEKGTLSIMCGGADEAVAAARLVMQSYAGSEERRVGNECVSTCRSRWSQYH